MIGLSEKMHITENTDKSERYATSITLQAILLFDSYLFAAKVV